MSNSPGGLLIIERLLRDRDSVWRQIIDERGLGSISLQMLASSSLSFALYGVVLGASHSWIQAVSSFVKLPLLFLATLAICLPTLYLFNLVFGARLSVMQAVTLIMVPITVTAVLTLAFAPISLFFLITSNSYSFFKLLNVAILVLTAIVGLRFLTAGMTAFNEHQLKLALVASAVERENSEEVLEPEPALVGANGASAAPLPAVPVPAGPVPAAPGPADPAYQGMLPGGWEPYHQPRRPSAADLPPGHRPASMTLLYIWIGLFGFVGTQLAWTLRPFFGSPDEPFAVFRDVNGTFYADILTTIGRLIAG
ncbi:hypothetical protein J2S43_004956 [Catenuloplanes nepalensis]|uniref:Actin-binding WH2 domain-containing protein n=1 Tax=Catenuloplanes nepalensis TaxID=587533 RepID=A0ABT9MYH7_9ACTN|nr:hypothetical protein [Catenuloplanes nepalensis]MDP9796444.1 hypothetical protein [Catenuloplanes nepalensis]